MSMTVMELRGYSINVWRTQMKKKNQKPPSFPSSMSIKIYISIAKHVKSPFGLGCQSVN